MDLCTERKNGDPMILDVGCGGSEEYKIHKIRGNINIDIQIPTQKIPNFIQADAHFLPLKGDTFDEVKAFDLIEHLSSPNKFLAEVYRVLKNKGKLQIGTPNALYLPKIVRACLTGTYIPHPDHIATWGLPELRNLLSDHFDQIQINYITYNYDSKWYNVLTRKIPIKAIRGRHLLVEAIK